MAGAASQKLHQRFDLVRNQCLLTTSTVVDKLSRMGFCSYCTSHFESDLYPEERNGWLLGQIIKARQTRGLSRKKLPTRHSRIQGLKHLSALQSVQLLRWHTQCTCWKYIHSFLLLEAHFWYSQVASYVCIILALVCCLHNMSMLTVGLLCLVYLGEWSLLQNKF